MLLMSVLTSCENKMFVRGDGTYFYAEIAELSKHYLYIHHSTLDCPAIKKGVRRGRVRPEESENWFCPVCMDDELIDKWDVFYKDKMSKINHN